MSYLGTGHTTDTFRYAMLAALAVHAAVIFGVSFERATGEYRAPQIEVTLATRPSEPSPDEPTHIAASDQAGSGTLADLTQLTSRESLPIEGLAEQQNARRLPAEIDASFQDALTTSAMNQRVVNTDIRERDHEQERLDGINPEIDRINRELASLQAELDEQTRAYAQNPRVRRLTAASAKQSVDAAYLLDWRRRLEAVGNRYYPEASVRYGIYGDLRLLVVIRSDGSLEDIQIMSSSGYAVLDEAAIKIVRMAAPYSPFPPELKATTDKLEIVRTWQFRQNQLSSSQGRGAADSAL